MRKPRVDSKLKTLGAAQRADLFREIEEKGYAAALAFAKSRLGVKTSAGALHEFRSWYLLAQRYDRAASRAAQVEELLRKGDVDPDKIVRAGQAIFAAEAQEGDIKDFIALSQLRCEEWRATVKIPDQRQL